MSKYRSLVVVVLAAAAIPIAAQAADVHVVQQREIAPALVAGSGSGATAQDCYVAPCPSPRPERECGSVTNGSTWVVAQLRVRCDIARALVLKLSRAKGLPGWNCHRAGYVQGHCEDSSSPKGKVRAIFWWLDEGGESKPPPKPPPVGSGWRTVSFKAKDPDTNRVGASAQVTWMIRSRSRPGGGTLQTLEYYGTVTDTRGRRYARIFRTGAGSTRFEIATARSGNSTSFGSRRNPIETSLPSHFSLCIYEGDSPVACTDRFSDAVRLGPARQRWKCNSDWMSRMNTVGRGRDFVAHIVPTGKARWEGNKSSAQRDMWRAFEVCVRLGRHDNFGMNADQLHMLRLQLDCHAWYAAIDKRGGGTNLVSGGPTWDLEANTPKMSRSKLFRTTCDTKPSS
jgi:hypothetical protein